MSITTTTISTTTTTATTTTKKSTDFKFKIDKRFKFHGVNGKYTGTIRVYIYLVDGHIPDIIRTSEEFMNQAITNGWGTFETCDDTLKARVRYVELQGSTPEEIELFVEKRVNALVEQLKAIHRRNVEAMSACPSDSIIEYTLS